MQLVEQFSKDVAEVSLFKAPTGGYRGFPRYQKGEGFGFAHADHLPSDVYFHISNASRIEIDYTGPELKIFWSQFENFDDAVSAVDPPQESDRIVILDQKKSLRNGKAAIEATAWAPLYEMERLLDEIETAPLFRVRMVMHSTEGKLQGKTLLEGNSEPYIRYQYSEQKILRESSLRIGGKTIQTEIRMEMEEDGSWVPA